MTRFKKHQQFKSDPMKNILIFPLALLLSFTAAGQNDSILPNVFGQYTVQQDWGDDSNAQYTLHTTIINENPGEDTLEVYEYNQHVARIALDGYKAYIKKTEFAIQTNFFANPHFGDDWEILYDFSLEVGDSACFHYGSVMTVASIDTIYVQGEPRKVLHLDGGWQEQWIQGVGSNWHPLAPKIQYFENFEKLCGAALTYQGPSPVDSAYYSQPCEISGLTESGTTWQFDIRPNPTAGMFNIILPDIRNAEVVIYDLSGRIVYRGTVKNETTRVSSTSFAPGMYLVQIRDKRGAAVRKIVVE